MTNLVKKTFEYRGWVVTEYKKITTAREPKSGEVLFKCDGGDIRPRVDNFIEKQKEFS